MVSSKHLLIIGGGNTIIKDKIIDNFSDTWRIANLDIVSNNKCALNI